MKGTKMTKEEIDSLLAVKLLRASVKELTTQVYKGHIRIKELNEEIDKLKKEHKHDL
tara:strand:+ start:167 stop:337 length:171 start_codon:yes stop_codon:yes gene_type:complete